MDKHKNELLLTALFLLTWTAFLFALFFYIRDPEVRGEARQRQEEKAAEVFLSEAVRIREMREENDLIPSGVPEDDLSDVSLDLPEDDSSNLPSDLPEDDLSDALSDPPDSFPVNEDLYKDPSYEDNDLSSYSLSFTVPQGAAGRPLCVLEIPSIGLRRIVFTGTREEIGHNLDSWMVTAARPDYELGKTHFCIYGHNSTTRRLSFNYLKDVVPGDLFYLVTEKRVFTYRVTRFFADWRECVTSDLVDNFTIAPDKCYIITCGRDRYRYRDIVIEGTLEEETGTESGKEDPSEGSEALASGNGKDVQNEAGDLPKGGEKAENPDETGARISVWLENGRIKAALVPQASAVLEEEAYPAGSVFSGIRLCLADEEGRFLCDSEKEPVTAVTDGEGLAVFPDTALVSLVPGKLYVVGILDRESMISAGDTAFQLLETGELKEEEDRVSMINTYRLQIMRFFLVFSGLLTAVSTGFFCAKGAGKETRERRKNTHKQCRK